MKRKSFLGITLISIAIGLVIVGASGNAYTQGEEGISFTYGKGTYAKSVNIEISLDPSDRQKFLKDPVSTLRGRRIAVPESAETHWQQVTILLRRLANPGFPSARRKPGRTTFANIVLERGVTEGVVVRIVGNWDADTADSPGRTETFLADPIATLRSHDVDVRGDDGRDWRELAAALRALQRAYEANGRSQSSASSDLTDVTPTSAAQRLRIIEGYSAEFYAGNRIENGPIVGTCNSGTGCDALKAACSSLPKHTFKEKNGDGSLGVCVGQSFDRMSSDGGNRTTDFGLAAPKKSGDATFRCHGFQMCSKVKRICATQGGKYTAVDDRSGACDEGEQHAAKEREAGNNEMMAEREKEKSEALQRPPVRRIPARPDLTIRQFLFPPTNDKALRVHVVNVGQVSSGACRLVLTVRKINGVPVGRQTHVNVPALAAGADTWLLIDAKSILPNSVKLNSTTFKLNVDATEIVAESNESNNEIWHNL